MKQLLILMTLAAPAFAADFKLEIGSAFAAIPPAQGAAPVRKMKNAVFAVRAEGCADPAKMQISGTAEGLVDHARQTLALKSIFTPSPGVFAISREWPSQGEWVVSLTATCDGAKAGALVPTGPGGFVRASVQSFPRPARDAEMEASLKALAEGGK